MESTPPETEKSLGKDVKTFERLPVKTKELLILMDQAEKTIGKKNAAIHIKIQKKSK